MPEPDATILSTRHPRYPNHYVWFVFISALDIMLTWVILNFGGREVNDVAVLSSRGSACRGW